MAQFFISHSAVEGSRAAEVLTALEGLLKGSGHDVFAQSRIREGEQWKARIYDELGRCEAAIVLVDERAIRPDAWWVRREVYNLLWRQYFGMVRLQAVQLDDLGGRRAGDLGLGELRDHQWVRARTVADPAAVAVATAAAFADLKPAADTVMTRWIDELTDMLSELKPGKTLDRFAERLGVDADEWGARSGAPGSHRFLASQLLGKHEPENMSLAIKTVLHVLHRGPTLELARRATPALVDVEAATRLLRPPEEPASSDPEVDPAAGSLRRPDDPAGTGVRPMFLLNAGYWSTAQLYVRRASCCSYTYRCAYISLLECGESPEEDLVLQSDIALAKLLGIPERQGPHSKRTRDEVADFRPGKDGDVEAGFLVIHVAGYEQFQSVAKELDALRKRVSWPAFIVMDRDESSHWAMAEEQNELPVGFEIIKPLLGDEEERTIDRVLQRLEDDIAGGELFDATDAR